MMKVIATSKQAQTVTDTKIQLDRARRELTPAQSAQLDDAMAEHFTPEENLQFEVERFYALLAHQTAADEPSPQIDRALARIERFLAQVQPDRALWPTAVIKHVKRSRLELSDETLARLSALPSPPRSPAWDNQVDVKFLLRQFGRASDIEQRFSISGELHRIEDVARMVRDAGGSDPGGSDLVRERFSDLTQLVRNTFEALREMQLRGKPPLASALEQLLWLNGVLEHAPGSSAGGNDRAKLLTPLDQAHLQSWLSALRPNPESVARANSDEPIAYDVGDIRQYRPNACGDACVQAILRHHDLPFDPYGTNDRPVWRGTDKPQMRQQLSEQGIGTIDLLPTTFRQISRNELRQWLAQHGPLVASSADHAVLVTGIEGDTVTIHCPLMGSRQASLADLNRYLNWQETPSPLAATYRAGAPTVPFVHQPMPGRVQRFAARAIVGTWEKAYTREWQTVQPDKPKKKS
ncbi:papain-like cysteine protease family protein [Peristeroidobacter soli]|uniref:papain-like cysteine protease family protein n=1 Tax=Peristeroidobacter soli TaxID=2497877 RepID=UPI0013002B13|nr:papain-like cysteine protease family protein [Peristeroidobacter soli]